MGLSSHQDMLTIHNAQLYFFSFLLTLISILLAACLLVDLTSVLWKWMLGWLSYICYINSPWVICSDDIHNAAMLWSPFRSMSKGQGILSASKISSQNSKYDHMVYVLCGSILPGQLYAHLKLSCCCITVQNRKVMFSPLPVCNDRFACPGRSILR